MEHRRHFHLPQRNVADTWPERNRLGTSLATGPGTGQQDQRPEDLEETLASLRERLGIAPANSLGAAKGYDLGRLVAEGLARAPERTREGVKEGLELVKWLPAAEGHEGTLLGFGKHDRGALHGRYLVMRQWLDGNSVELELPGRGD